MDRRIILLLALLVPIPACQRTADVAYRADGYRNSPDIAPKTATATVATASGQTTPSSQRPPTAAERFERDFSNPGRFLYRNGFRLDRWTGCVTSHPSGVPLMNARGDRECGYLDGGPAKD